MNLNEKQQKDFLILAVTGMLAWGGSWASAKAVANLASPQTLVFWRFLLTFISFIPIMFIFKQSFKISLKTLGIIVAGGFFMSLYSHLFFLALRKGTAGMGGVLVTSLNPMLTFLLMVILFRQKTEKKDWAGVILGLFGGLVMIQVWEFSYEKLMVSGNLIFLIASLVWSFLTLASHEGGKRCGPFVFSFYLYGIASVFNFFLALDHGVLDVASFSPLLWWNLGYLSLVATTFGTTVYFFATQKLGSGKASSLLFLVPAGALFFGWLFLDEHPGIPTLTGGALASFAVYLIHRKKPFFKKRERQMD